MVKVCSTDYISNDENSKYNEYFEKYPYSLSSFQKYAIEAIVEGHHILVTAHTGSGKTLPAEFAIEHFVTSKKKKVIYTSPIKALSNQKFYEFTQKFPNISFGILTGDIKTNPEADVLIMTTEILLNTLYSKYSKTETNNRLTMFDMDFTNELACVIFDEVHYINDADRGKVWEETIMLLPRHVQMVMLSATLDSPEKFARWCEQRGLNDNENNDNENNKIVYLASTYERVVPLTHYTFITCTQGIFKILKDKQLEMEIMKTTNTFHVLQDSKGNFNDTNYQKVKKMLNLFEDKEHCVKRQHVLNTVSKLLVERTMLPAICFVLSRKQLEKCAKEVTTVLLEDDSKVPYIVKKECEQIIRKLPNYQEYLSLPEYNELISLLQKGIAIHHAGMMPILREMVELLFAKGYIKLLFATETFAVGINMPTKTVLFTDVTKWDGSSNRTLLPHEYTQMAGRAGRRGIDTIGHVIHLTNLFRSNESFEVKNMMKGKAQLLVSKFKISYNLLLNLINIGVKDFSSYINRSMIQQSVTSEINANNKKLEELELTKSKLEETLSLSSIPHNIINEYSNLKEQIPKLVNKKRKEAERQIQKILDLYPRINDQHNNWIKMNKINDEIGQINGELIEIKQRFNIDVKYIMNLLVEEEFVAELKKDFYSLTLKGVIASHLKEVHCLTFGTLLFEKKLNKLTSIELIGVLSCFTNISVQEEKREQTIKTNNNNILNTIQNIEKMYQQYFDYELKNRLDVGIDYLIHYELINYCVEWCECTDETECKLVLQKMASEKDIFLGEFVKAILKINNIASEMEKVAEIIGDMEFLSRLKEIPILTLKFVATNQSLYV